MCGNKNDITIIIQGGINKISINNICNYSRFGNVIVSTWKGCNRYLKWLARWRGAKVISSSGREYLYKEQNINCQCLSTLSGLEVTKTPFAIKVRSDEYYSDLTRFIQVMKQNDQKLVTNNIFFRRNNEAPFHPSDHVIGGRTENLLATFRQLKITLRENVKNNAIYAKEAYNFKSNFGYHVEGEDSIKINHLVAEQLMALSFLKVKNVCVSVDNARSSMLEYFSCVNVADMGEFHIACNSCRQKVLTSPEEVLTYRSIKDMDDL